MSVKNSLKISDTFPYDATDTWWKSPGSKPPIPKDWAHRAARGIIADLKDRRGIKNGFDDIDEERRAEIVATLAEIIRTAYAERTISEQGNKQMSKTVIYLYKRETCEWCGGSGWMRETESGFSPASENDENKSICPNCLGKGEEVTEITLQKALAEMKLTIAPNPNFTTKPWKNDNQE